MPGTRARSRRRRAGAPAPATASRGVRENDGGATTSATVSAAMPPGAAPATPQPLLQADQLRTLLADMIRELLPTATAPPATSAAHPPATMAPEVSALAPVAPYSVKERSEGMSAQRGNSMCEASSTVGATIRQRIIEERCVDLGMLLDSADRGGAVDDERTPTFQLIDGLLRPAARTPRTIHTFAVWRMAFLRYTGIYLEAHPHAATGLLAHMRQVSQLTAPGLGTVWREFDKGFRKCRETAPELHQWSETAVSSTLWLQAIAKGIRGATMMPPMAAHPSPTNRFRFCHGYNLPRGCTIHQCRFPHICRTCRGPTQPHAVPADSLSRAQSAPQRALLSPRPGECRTVWPLLP